MEVHVNSKNTIPAFQPRSKRAKEQLREAIVLESERQQYPISVKSRVKKSTDPVSSQITFI